MIDIAVPRDLDPAIASVENVFLYDIDDLEGIVEMNMEHRRQEAERIEAMIGDGREEFYQWYRTLGVVPLIRALQEKAEDIHRSTMDSLTKKLPDLDERELKIIRKLTKSIVNQMMHDPIHRIKEIAGDKKADDAMEMFAKLFALEEGESQQPASLAAAGQQQARAVEEKRRTPAVFAAALS